MLRVGSSLPLPPVGPIRDVGRRGGLWTGRPAYLSVRLQTGRTHQIRVHMKAIGHPVCGDREYGHKDLYGLKRQFLHAARLAFAHPVTGEGVDLGSPLPDDLVAALTEAEH